MIDGAALWAFFLSLLTMWPLWAFVIGWLVISAIIYQRGNITTAGYQGAWVTGGIGLALLTLFG